jgi:mannonate dehydratase
VASYLSDHVLPLLIGRDARRIEDIWQYLYKGAYWRRGPVTMTAIAAVDMALWDVLGKTLDTPVYPAARRRLARRRDGLRSRERFDRRRDREGGPRSTWVWATRRCARSARFPASSTPTASVAARFITSRRRKACRSRACGAPSGTSIFVPPLFDRLRREVGFDVHLLHDVHHRLTPIEAARLGKSLEPYRLFWLEDPVPAENQAAFRTIRPAHDDADCGWGSVQHDLRRGTS